MSISVSPILKKGFLHYLSQRLSQTLTQWGVGGLAPQVSPLDPPLSVFKTNCACIMMNSFTRALNILFLKGVGQGVELSSKILFSWERKTKKKFSHKTAQNRNIYLNIYPSMNKVVHISQFLIYCPLSKKKIVTVSTSW